MERKNNNSKRNPGHKRQVYSSRSNENPPRSNNNESHSERHETHHEENASPPVAEEEFGSEGVSSNNSESSQPVEDNPMWTYEHKSSIENPSSAAEYEMHSQQPSSSSEKHSANSSEKPASNSSEKPASSSSEKPASSSSDKPASSSSENHAPLVRESKSGEIRSQLDINHSNSEESVPDPEQKSSPPKELELVGGGTEEQIYHHRGLGRYRIHKIDPDGNCLFRALAWYVFDNQSFHLLIRHMVMHQVYNNWEYYQHFAEEGETLQSYMRRIEVYGEFGSEMELVGFSHVFRCKVDVFYKDNPKRNPWLIGTDEPSCLVLFSGPIDRGHYDVLEPESPDSLGNYTEAIDALRQRVAEEFQEAMDEVWDVEASQLTIAEIIEMLTNSEYVEKVKKDRKTGGN